MKVIVYTKNPRRKTTYHYVKSIMENMSNIGLGGEIAGAIHIEKKNIRKIKIKF